MTRRLTNVCFTLNDPQEEITFLPDFMGYLIYQLELSESGTPHFQGYMELKERKTLAQIKTLLGSHHVHIEARRGTSEQASEYCRKDDTYVEGGSRFEYGEMKYPQPGKRNDLKEFKDAVLGERKRKRELFDDHYGTIARYPKFYSDLTLYTRPTRREAMEVVLHIGATGLGKTRTVMDRHGEDPSFFITPLSNNTSWYDTYDFHDICLLDDFAGAASHMQLTTLLRLLDRYPVMVPVKGSHVWWMPRLVYVTTNIDPKDWYSWTKRGSQYLALARRFTKVLLFYPKLFPEDPGFVEQDENWWKDNCPSEAELYYD